PFENDFWVQITAALAECRLGDAAAALRRLQTQVKPFPDHANTQALVDAVLALAYLQLGSVDEAREALARAKAALADKQPRPELGWRYDYDWHNWLQVEILVREAEGRMPYGPAVIAAASSARDQAPTRSRRERADQLVIEHALALIRLDAGQKAEAE